MSSGENPRVARAAGFVSYDSSYAGDCWYWDEQMHQWIGAARYQYDNSRHTNTDSTVRTFSPLTITYSDVCPDDNSTGSQYSADGWRFKAAHSLCIGDKLLRQDLQGDLASQSLVLGQVNFAHSAGGQ